MEGILDAIFSNIFIILALLAGLFGFFKTDEKRDENPNKPDWRESNQNQPQQQGTLQEQYETIKEDVRTTIEDTKQSVEDFQSDATNEWYQALENTQRNLEDSLEDSKRMEMSDAIKSASIVAKDRRETPEISVRENFTRKRLVESLIMSEVLDRPKSQRRSNV